MEHRLGYRVPVRETVQVRTTAGEVAEAVTIDISLSGAFIHTRLNPPCRAPIHVTFADSTNPSRCVSVVEAQVVRNTADGIGIEWSQFAAAPVMKRVAGRTTGDVSARSRKERQPA